MIRSLITCFALTCFLGLAAFANGVQAADSKDKLPKSGKPDKPLVEQPKAKPAPSEAASKGSDRFIDNDHNGVDDRRETKVIRSEEQKPPPTVKKESEPPKAKPPTTAKPPGR